MLNEILKKRQLNFKDIVELQSELNKKSDPKNPDWKKERTVIDYKLASVIELFELVESAPWKWWKGGTTDHWNIKIEAIDMLHFLSSNISLYNNLKSEDEEKILGFLETENITANIFKDGSVDNPIDRNKAFSILKDIVNNEESFEMINSVMKDSGLSSNEISAIYISKYALNEIRWENGYALNEYKKMKDGYTDENGLEVDGVEDNVFLKGLVDNFEKNKDMTLGELRNSIFETFKDKN